MNGRQLSQSQKNLLSLLPCFLDYLLATFQAIINKLLRDLINIIKVRSFIDNIMVETETEKEHDELVEEILKRLK